MVMSMLYLSWTRNKTVYNYKRYVMSSSAKEDDNELRKKFWAEFANTALKHYITRHDAAYESRIKWAAGAADDMMKELDKRFGK